MNIASSEAFQPMPFMAVYAAAKAYLLSFSLALGAELRAACRPDAVLTVVPAGTKTDFQATAGPATNPREHLLSPDDLAAVILKVLNDRHYLALIGSRAADMSLAASVIPLHLQAPLWEKLMQKLR